MQPSQVSERRSDSASASASESAGAAASVGAGSRARAWHQGWWADVRRILPLAWPVFIGQLAVLAFNTIDTLLVARHSQADLAAFAVGTAAYVTVFVGLMGMVLAVSPAVGRLYGAGQLQAAGDELHQGIWLALALSLLGGLLLMFPAPFLRLAQASPEVAAKVRAYLGAQAFSLPAALLFTVFRAFNTAVSRPKAVMLLQLGGLALKGPLTAALVSGLPAWGLPELGVAGCGVATAVALWGQVIVAAWLLRRDAFYQPFALWGHGLRRPSLPALRALLRLGLPMGATILIEVSAFSAMALFIARIGTGPVAGHQIAMNLVSLMYMLPLALANATSTLAAQRIGAADLPDARRLGWHGVQLGALLAAALGGVIFLGRTPVLQLYTADAAVVADAVQVIVAFALRSWHIATAPMLIYAGSLWGVGIGLGYLLAFNVGGEVPQPLRGAAGFWTAATVGLLLTSLLLCALMAWVLRRQAQQLPSAPPPADG